MSEIVIEQFCNIANVSIDEFKGKSRKVHVTIARQCYMKYLVKNTRMSLSSIGRTINRDHATVINGIKHIDGLIKTKDKLVEPYKALLNYGCFFCVKEKYIFINKLILKKNKNGKNSNTDRRNIDYITV